MRAKDPDISTDLLRALLHYDPATGAVMWAPASGRQGYAGTKTKFGYMRLEWRFGRTAMHRVIWKYMTGMWPCDFVDHINGVRDDNRWCNLREADTRLNAVNCRLPKTNTSGYRGVCRARCKSKPWRAQVWVDGKRKAVGNFATPEEAHAAYVAVAQELYGNFART